MTSGAWAPYTDNVLGDWATSTWLTLLSCRPFADDDTAGEIEAAMAGLDDIADYAQLLALNEQVHWLVDVVEIDSIARSILDHLRATATGRE
jgi:hypothetical protein